MILSNYLDKTKMLNIFRTNQEISNDSERTFLKIKIDWKC